MGLTGSKMPKRSKKSNVDFGIGNMGKHKITQDKSTKKKVQVY